MSEGEVIYEVLKSKKQIPKSVKKSLLKKKTFSSSLNNPRSCSFIVSWEQSLSLIRNLPFELVTFCCEFSWKWLVLTFLCWRLVFVGTVQSWLFSWVHLHPSVILNSVGETCEKLSSGWMEKCWLCFQLCCLLLAVVACLCFLFITSSSSRQPFLSSSWAEAWWLFFECSTGLNWEGRYCRTTTGSGVNFELNVACQWMFKRKTITDSQFITKKPPILIKRKKKSVHSWLFLHEQWTCLSQSVVKDTGI